MLIWAITTAAAWLVAIATINIAATILSMP